MNQVSHIWNIPYHINENSLHLLLVPAGPPINITVVNKSPSSITISWLPPDPLDANGVITAYTFLFNRVKAGDLTRLNLSASQLSYTILGMLFTLYNLIFGQLDFSLCFAVSCGMISFF